MIRTRLWQSSTAIFLALLFWISVVVFPTGPHEISDSARRFTLVMASILGLAAVVVAFMNQRDQTKKKHYLSALASTLALVSVADFIFYYLAPVGFVLKDGDKLAIGVGGTAIAAFAYGITQFDSMRAAASAPVVVLLVGVSVWPDAQNLMETSVRQALIQWMGILLGANGAAEAAKQIGVATANSRSGDDSKVGVAPGDLATVNSVLPPPTGQ